MFGQNEIVGKRFFSTAEDRKLLVTSIFFTLQGGGPFRGQPAVFVRLAKCNLSCSFCDTYFDSGDWLSFEEIFEKAGDTIDRFFEGIGIPAPVWAVNRQVVLVITGGEPTLQNNLNEFLWEAHEIYPEVQIESNGIIEPLVPEQTVVVISPKCAEGENGVATRYLRPNKKSLERADYLKFVVEAPQEKRQGPYSCIPEWAVAWADETRRQVFVSPMNIYRKEPQKAKELRSKKKNVTLRERSTVDEVISFWEPGLLDMEANQKNHEFAAWICMRHGFVLNLQLHLYASLP